MDSNAKLIDVFGTKESIPVLWGNTHNEEGVPVLFVQKDLIQLRKHRKIKDIKEPEIFLLKTNIGKEYFVKIKSLLNNPHPSAIEVCYLVSKVNNLDVMKAFNK